MNIDTIDFTQLTQDVTDLQDAIVALVEAYVKVNFPVPVKDLNEDMDEYKKLYKQLVISAVMPGMIIRLMGDGE